MPLAGPRDALASIPSRTGLLPVCYQSATGHALTGNSSYIISAGRQSLLIAALAQLNGEIT